MSALSRLRAGRASSLRRISRSLPGGLCNTPPTTRLYATEGHTTITHGGIEDPTAFCRDLVRKHDYEGHIVHPFYPKSAQAGYFALKSFYVELATIQESVSNPTIGKMRIQFWRDAVKSLSTGRPTRHPIALALHDASQQARLAPYHLKRIVDARDMELDNPTHLTLDSLTAHAESTTSTLLYLLLSLLRLHIPAAADLQRLSQSHDHAPAADPLDPDTLAHAASHLGVAQHAATLLRALPFHASRSHMPIPAEITARHNVRQEDVFRRGGAAAGIDDAVYEFACFASGHLNSAREMFAPHGGLVPAPAMPLFLSGVPVASYLARLEAVNFDAFHPSLRGREWKLPWAVWRGYYKRTF